MSPRAVKRNIIVTGASRGLGREIALVFGKAGERVAVNYLSGESEAQEVASEIARSGGEAFPFKADVTSASGIDSLFTCIAERWGGVDVLVNNAGITRDTLLLRMTEQDWNSVLDVNLKGPFNCIRAASRLMSKEGKGHIINIASIVGVQGREGQANYAAAKSALIGLTRAAARELGASNIQVNAVLPGYLLTGMGEAVSQSILDGIIRDNALKRVSDPGEVARFIHHLSSMKNVSGQVFNLDSRIL
jgi:3-oxoacyl-[acyl-carrier protein] reductase